MKKSLIGLILLLQSMAAIAQLSDSLFSKKAVRSTEFEYLFSYYQQDGNHSAVTGGIGTEKLDVFINKVSITHTADSFNTFYLEGGIDVISSASTDNIDMRISSASAIDSRLWVSMGYQRSFKNSSSVGVKPSFSIESDYLSWGVATWYNHQNQDKNWRYGVDLQLFFDDLRWGRLNDDYRAPVTVVYPKELRDSVWFDIYMRYSYNLHFNVQHDINKRMNLGLFFGVMKQEGLLSTPFHRFYFKDTTVAVVENLPRKRVKIPVGIQLNSFIGNRTILQTYYRYYWDNFGIKGHTLSIEVPIKITPLYSIAPFLRMYWQEQSSYYFPYNTASPEEPFFTSDPDLSKFSSIKIGGEFKLHFTHTWILNQMALRYAYYKRSDDLYFNQLSLYLSVK